MPYAYITYIWWRRWDLNPRPKPLAKAFLRAQFVVNNFAGLHSQTTSTNVSPVNFKFHYKGHYETLSHLTEVLNFG